MRVNEETIHRLRGELSYLLYRLGFRNPELNDLVAVMVDAFKLRICEWLHRECIPFERFREEMGE